MSDTIFSFKAYSFRTFPTPLDDQGIHSYHCVIPITEIPKDFLNWMDVNAREPSLSGRVPKAIRTTLNEQPEYFIAYNRGLAILAENIEYDNRDKQVKITFKDKMRHGVFDGGHTLAVIQDKLSSNGSNEQEPAYCKLEIMTGVPTDMITDIVDARNTSRQVASKSLLNLEGSFSDLKNSMGNGIQKMVAWKENEDAAIDVREVIALLTTFDRIHYSDTKHPIVAYTGKEACLKHFDLNPECYQKIYPITKDILRLCDQIQDSVPEQYNAQGGRFGKLTGCSPLKKPRELPIIGGTISYVFPNGYLYPIVAAFRSMLHEENGVYSWGKGIDPCKLVKDGLATKIFIGSVVNSINSAHNPNRTGKDANVWALAYQIAENHFLRINT
jgi:hypothetical protein